MGLHVTVKNNTRKIERSVAKESVAAFSDVVLDIKRVSSESAPHLTGHLENNRVRFYDRNLSADIKFKAMSTTGRRSFNYAKWTHDASYNLGEKSARKRGGSSKFGSSVPVGPGYLSNTIENGADGYFKHLGSAYKTAFKKGR